MEVKLVKIFGSILLAILSSLAMLGIFGCAKSLTGSYYVPSRPTRHYELRTVPYVRNYREMVA